MAQSLSSNEIVNLGEEHYAAGRLQDAESCYRKALEMDPSHSGAYYRLANIAYEDNRLTFASQLVERLLKGEPNKAEAWHLWGMIAAKQGNLRGAAERLIKALVLQPTQVLTHYNLGNVLGRLGNIPGALTSFEKAVTLNPEFADAYFAIGNIRRKQNRLDVALVNYRRVIEIKPDFEHAYIGISQILHMQGKPDAAIEICRQALAVLPRSAMIHLNLGIALRANGQYADAVRSLNCAVLYDPNNVDAYLNLGFSHLSLRSFAEGQRAFERLVALMPNSPHAQIYLAKALIRLGRLSDAIACWNKAAALAPNLTEPYHHLLCFKHYLPTGSRQEIFSEHVSFGERFEAPLRKTNVGHHKPPAVKKRLRLGFVSADLYSHSVGLLLEAVLRELYQLDKFDIFVYVTNARSDSVTERLRATTHAWLPVYQMSDDAFAQRIRSDGIDVLIDLSGHNIDNRLLAFARKPAPIQVTWLGYWDTTGLQSIDYILCDSHGVRDDELQFFVEKPWYLPHNRLCFFVPTESVDVGSLPALSEGYIMFGCFNHLLKMTDHVVSVWSQILQRVPGARLMLKSAPLSDEKTREAVIASFSAHGIDSERLELEAASSYREYLLAYNRVDIALDPFPFPGGVTSADGLWMGVPMITMCGDRMISRQGSGMLAELDLQDWIAVDDEDYIEKAVRKACDIPSLVRRRAELRTRFVASPLCDARGFASNLSHAFENMWLRYCQEFPRDNDNHP